MSKMRTSRPCWHSCDRRRQPFSAASRFIALFLWLVVERVAHMPPPYGSVICETAKHEAVWQLLLLCTSFSVAKGCLRVVGRCNEFPKASGNRQIQYKSRGDNATHGTPEPEEQAAPDRSLATSPSSTAAAVFNTAVGEQNERPPKARELCYKDPCQAHAWILIYSEPRHLLFVTQRIAGLKDATLPSPNRQSEPLQHSQTRMLTTASNIFQDSTNDYSWLLCIPSNQNASDTNYCVRVSLLCYAPRNIILAI